MVAYNSMGLEGKSPPMAAECQIDLAHRDVVHVEGHGGGLMDALKKPCWYMDETR